MNTASATESTGNDRYLLWIAAGYFLTAVVLTLFYLHISTVADVRTTAYHRGVNDEYQDGLVGGTDRLQAATNHSYHTGYNNGYDVGFADGKQVITSIYQNR